MNAKGSITTIFILTASAVAFGQGAPRPGQGGPPRGGQGGPPPMGEGMQRSPKQRDWFKDVDANKDGKLDATEFKSALDSTFTEIDRNANGMIDSIEMPHPPKGGQRAPQGGRPQGPPNGPPPMNGVPGQFGPDGPNGPDKLMLPPFFFADRSDENTSLSRSDFDRVAQNAFSEMDRNGDGVLTKEEARPPKRPDAPNGPPEGMGAPPPPNGQFIAAEMRFGDKLVKGQPFSAETVIEDTRRLFDGSTATSSRHGAIYRDSAGRTRREQPLEIIGGVNITGSDGKPQILVFINDFDSRTQYFLDTKNKVARKHGIAGDPPGEPPAPEDAKTESLGKKTIEGVEAEGTRVTFEIPAGQFGNNKAIQVVSESWFSPELQMIVYSRHLDPLAGEHVFRLVNIKRGEQTSDLFTVPSDFEIETGDRNKRPE